MKNVKITFSVKELPFYCVSHKNGRKTFEVQAFDDLLSVAVQYDYERKPLEMNCPVAIGDRVEIVLLPYRIELYVNGVCKDEEWPAGERLFDLADTFTPDMPMQICEYVPEPKEQPAILSSFENAQGWYPGDGVFVGDCMPYRKDDEYHVLYLKDRHHHRSKWLLGAHQWEHISTKDFKTWYVHPMAVPITDPSEGSICTGSWIRNGSKEYLYYTVRRGKGLPAPICRSVSEDGYHFEKDTSFGFAVSERYDAPSARDPKVVKGEDGLFHMFLTTSLVQENKGCLAHYISADMEKWEDAGEPIYVAPNSDQPECPDYFCYQGKYYLIFSLRSHAHYMVSEQPFSGFVEPENAVIPCASVPKGAPWQDKLIFAGFQAMGGYGGYMTFKAATAIESGELVFEEV